MGDEAEGHEEPDKPDESIRSYIDDYATNWREFKGPLWEKIALSAKNRAKAYTVGMGCCGHPGEPGC